MKQQTTLDTALESLKLHRVKAFVIVSLIMLITSVLSQYYPQLYENRILFRIISSDKNISQGIYASIYAIFSKDNKLDEIFKVCGISKLNYSYSDLVKFEDLGGGLINLVIRHSNPTVLKDLAQKIIKTVSDELLSYSSANTPHELASLNKQKSLLDEKINEIKMQISALNEDKAKYLPLEVQILYEEVKTLKEKINDQRKRLQSIPRIKIVPSKELTKSYTDTYNALMEARNKLFELLKTYREKHPKVVAVTTQIDKLEEKLKGYSTLKDKEALNPEYVNLKKEIEQDENNLAKIQEKIQSLLNSCNDENYLKYKTELENLKSRLSSLETLQKEVILKIETITISQATQSGQIQVINGLENKPKPIGLSYWERQFLAFVGGLFISILLLYSPSPVKAEIISISSAIPHEVYRDKLCELAYTSSSAEVLSIPYLVTEKLALPSPDQYISEKQIKPYDNRLIVLNEPASPKIEPYKLLSTNIQIALAETGLRIISVCSSKAGMGKTTVVANLGVLLAQTGYSVLLIDANMRKPSLHRVFALENNLGLSTALCGDNVVKYIQNAVLDNLFLLPAGPTPMSPLEALGSIRLIEVLDELKKRYEVILLDTPALFEYPDAGAIISQVGGVVLIQKDTESQEELKATQEYLKSIRAKLIGVVNC